MKTLGPSGLAVVETPTVQNASKSVKIRDPKVAPWVPLLPELMRAKTVPILEGIAEDLWVNRLILSPDLPDGLVGAAIFLGHLSLVPGFEAHRDRSETLYGMALEAADHAPGPSLFGGYVGLGWGASHLGHVLGWDVTDLCMDFDDLLEKVLQAQEPLEDYDLIGGLVGFGVYGLERLPDRRGVHILEAILDHLERTAVRVGSGITWPTPPHLVPAWQLEMCPAGYYNLGLAHGVPGVLALLATMEANGIQPQRVGKLARGGIEWIKGQFQNPEEGSRLANWCPIGQDRAKPMRSQIAWCYGDLGAAIALLNVARVVRDPDLEFVAIAMGELSASRPLDEASVRDACLCHGSAGNAHVFGRLYQATGNQLFKKAAMDYWDMTFEFHHPGQGFAGFTAYRPPEDEPMTSEKDPGFLGGAAGAGLALLAGCQEQDPSWDQCMLISSRLSLD